MYMKQISLLLGLILSISQKKDRNSFSVIFGNNWEFGSSMFGLNGTHLYCTLRVINAYYIDLYRVRPIEKKLAQVPPAEPESG